MRNAMMRKIHQENWELPMAAAGAAASATNTTQITVRIASIMRNFFFLAIRLSPFQSGFHIGVADAPQGSRTLGGIRNLLPDLPQHRVHASLGGASAASASSFVFGQR